MQRNDHVASKASRVESMGERLLLCATSVHPPNLAVGAQASKQSTS